MDFLELNDAIEGRNEENKPKCLVVLSHEQFIVDANTSVVIEEHTTDKAFLTMEYADELVRITLSFENNDIDELNYLWGIIEAQRVSEEKQIDEDNEEFNSYLSLMLIPTAYSGKVIVQGVCPLFVGPTTSIPGAPAYDLSFIFSTEDVLHNENDEVDIETLAIEAEREVDTEEEYEEMLEEKRREEEENYRRRLENAKKYRL